jgi:ferrochelatase
MKNTPTAVLLLNMGGPDTLNDVAPFLYNLFSDREIIRLGPAPLQKPLAWLISRRRAPKSRAIYEKIGGGSPLKRITSAQASALQAALECNGEHFPVRVAMRYWPPTAAEALKEFIALGVEKLIALPLYPHYSRATSGSSLAELRRTCRKIAPGLTLKEIPSWPDEPHYIQALAKRIREGIGKFNGQPVQLVYSAHSLPVSFIEQGDPYVNELQRTITALEKETGIKGRLCYQSRSGPVKWLSPGTSEMIRNLADVGCRNILMVPISFVSDHVETLYEIDMLFKDEAQILGMRLESTPSLNTEPLFIKGLLSLVQKLQKAG